MQFPERIGLIVGLSLFFCLLLFAAPPGVVFGDGAELTYGIATGQVVHPPGYPLYTLIGRSLLTVSPLPAPLVASFLSALFGTLTLAGFYLLLKRRGLSVGSGGVTLLVLGVAYPLWDVSIKAEVYTLAAFLFVSTIFFWDLVRSEGRGRLILWFIAGVSLTHHPLGVLNVLLAVHATWKTLPSFTLSEAVVFLFPLGLYLTLLAPGEGQPFNWPMIGSGQALYSHMLGGSFSRFFFYEGVVTPLLQVGRMTVSHLLVFPFFLVLFVAAGYWWYGRELGLLLVLQGLLLLVLSAYGVPDVRDFLFPSYLIAGLAFAHGVEAYRPRSLFGVLDVFLVVVLSWGLMVWLLGDSLRYNWRNYSVPERYATSVRTVDPGGTVLSDWSHYSVLRYYQLTEGFYPEAHLLTPTHRYENWPELIRFHDARGTVHTTIQNWDPPDALRLEAVGPLYRVSSQPDD